MAFNAESVEFNNFNPVTANYGPRDIHAVAAMVTSDNIGQWALEFEKDLDDVSGGKPRFYFVAEREGEEPIKLKMEAGVWIVKVWNELHVFKDGMFQKTFDVPKDQLRAVRKAHRDKELQLERELQEEIKEERAASEREMEEKFERVQETGDWSELSDGEKYVLKIRLREDEEIQELIAAARERKANRKITFHTEQGVTAPPVVGPDYHAGSLFRSEGQDPSFYENLNREVEEKLESAEYVDHLLERQAEKPSESEQTQFIPQVSIPIGPARPFKDDPSDTGQKPIYPEGDEPSGGNARGVGN